MKSIVIVSTYPEFGSKNIGDQLITDCTKALIKDIDAEVNISTIWRAAPWKSVERQLSEAEHIVFACLAIRPRMHEIEYPYMRRILESGVPFSIVAAGTCLPTHTTGVSEFGFSDETLALLKNADRNAKSFTTRGALSQEFCLRVGLTSPQMCGDIAFYDKRFTGTSFAPGKKIRRIIISDPHRSGLYLQNFRLLYDNVLRLFPDSELVVALHGENETVEQFCATLCIKCVRLFDDRHHGLNIYDTADLHVGFRVHAHVSALKRRVYSYLLEQDGRGCDYGLTLDKKLSVPSDQRCVPKSDSSQVLRMVKNCVRVALGKGRKPARPLVPSTSAVDQLIAMISNDLRNGFEKFEGLEKQIECFNQMNVSSLQDALQVKPKT